MFDSDVKSFWDDSVSDLFVDDNSEGSWVDVEDSSSSAMIIFVWHGFVDWTIDDNIDNITDFVGGKVLWHSDGSVVSESFLEFVSSSSLISVTVSHSCEQ